jgi:uncharacterized protein (DUF427 family)
MNEYFFSLFYERKSYQITNYKNIMAKAIWNNQVIAESTETVKVEGNHYFPPQSIHKEFFKDSALHTTCPYKGQASYHTIVVDGKENQDAAWYYPTTKKGFEKIAGYIAFWRGVEVTD